MAQEHKRTIAASVVARFAAAGAWLSARYPFVWRTRALPFIAIGLMATALVALAGTTSSIQRESLPGLSSLMTALSWWSFAVYGGLLLLIIDVVRRTRPIFSIGHGLRMFGCVVLSAVALLLPQYVFMRAVIPRIAALETESGLAMLLERHEKIRFGRCIAYASDWRNPPSPQRVMLEPDLRRYGLRISGATAYFPDCPLGTGLGVLAMDQTDDTREPPSIAIFEDRLRNVEAAQLYVRHAGGAYETVAMGHASVIMPAAVATAALGSFVSRTMILRSRFRATRRRLLGRHRWRRRLALRFDRQLARRAPVIWSSRVHSSIPQILALASSIYLVLIATSGWEDVIVLWLGLPTIVLVLFWVLRAQERARYLTTRLSHEIAVLLTHGAVFAVAAAPYALMVVATEEVRGTMAQLILTGSLLCALFQAARNSSALIAVGALLLAGAFVAAFSITVTQVFNTEEEVTALILGAVALCAPALAGWARIEGRPTLSRLLMGTFLVLGPLPGITLIVALAPRDSDLTPLKLVMFMLFSATTTAVCLRLTEASRRALAYSSK